MATDRRGARSVMDWLREDVVAGFLLIGGAIVALIAANTPALGAYEALRGITFGPESLHLNLSMQAWASDALLAVFFFIVGNELKQEFVHGELREPRRAMLPIVAALCGMVVPAALYALVNWGNAEAISGWGIPMATDIAFAVAILAVIGRHLPPALRTFLLTLAIVDDLGAIVVIAVFYTDHLAFAPLLGSFAALAVFGYLQRGKGLAARLDRSALPNWVVYVPLALVAWGLLHASGVHATIAGVAMGLLMRTVPKGGEQQSPSHRVEHLLRPWTNVIVLPVFAFMSAGVAFPGIGALFSDTVAIGVVLGLVGGKLIGILGGSWITTKLTSAELNPALKWIDIAGMALLAGIGFTVSLLITELSFPGSAQLVEDAKAGVIVASLLATLLSAGVLMVRSAHYRRHGWGDRAPETSGGTAD